MERVYVHGCDEFSEMWTARIEKVSYKPDSQGIQQLHLELKEKDGTRSANYVIEEAEKIRELLKVAERKYVKGLVGLTLEAYSVGARMNGVGLNFVNQRDPQERKPLFPLYFKMIPQG